MKSGIRMANDFKVEQTFDELGESVYELVVYELLRDEFGLQPSKYEIEWAEGIARKVRDSFLAGLDAAE